MSFTRDIRDFVEGARVNQEQFIRGVKIELFTAVVKDTPVDTGRLRGNWQATVHQKATGQLGDRPESAVISEIMANTGKAADTSYLTNNLPYAPVVEYGQYPNPPEKGTYDPRAKKYVILSAGGYSKKAPAGMVRRNVARFQRLVTNRLRKLKR